MMREDSIDYNILTFIDPPSTYPPSAPSLTKKIQQKFYQQCLAFLREQKKLYKISKKVQQRLASSITESYSLDEYLSQKSDRLQNINRQLKKLSTHHAQAEQRQQFLSAVCKFVNMEQTRKIMLSPKIIDQDKYILKLIQLNQFSKELANLNSDVKLILQVKQQINKLLQETIDRLIKGSISQNMIQRITSQSSQIFLRDPKISSVFITNLTNQRLNLFRVGLNPLINNISYVQNLSQLFQKIIQQWLMLLQNQIRIFQKQNNRKQIKNITRQAMSKLLAQLIPKMQRGIYKVKNIVQISKIRSCMIQLKNILDKFSDGQITWDPLSKLLVKMLIILQQELQNQAQKLQSAKYNIYSLVSYVPIRQHLQLIKQAKSYDPQNKQLNWQRGFKMLADSRDPTKQPNNKSLIIFNLNIWYLYSHVMKADGQFIQKAQSMIKEGISSIVNLNLAAVNKQYDIKNFQKVLDLSADIMAVKKLLHSQINLLGHEKLRFAVEQELNKKFVQDFYVLMLKHHNIQQGLQNNEVIEQCRKLKLNLNKYGKISQKLKIFTADQVKQIFN